MVDDEDIAQFLPSDSPLVRQSEAVRLQAAKGRVRAEKIDSIIKANIIQAVTMGLIPVPLLDVLALTHIQFKMLDELVKLYDIRYTKIERSVVRAFILGSLPVATVTGLSSVLKVMPGVGSFIGGASVSVSAGALTYATGKVFARHFELGGTLDDFNLEKANRQFRQEFRHGKQVAQELVTTQALTFTAEFKEDA
ncbi:DUF697 domain-containing protein [Thiothrix litoralis]|jgi:uncharacterized protein (DUF697 family)|uniref:DUF697 domain-containing protein n=1 Tax=Thiothrix litoralis TaxID=2891210 RepID=A0ABX7WPL6_9GAMM|nr:DUF697 domain-containing protein [Thiothrix litoralis]QTR45425.1 DUF697 domain-containing protein [Thiothrix litoralis]